MESLAWPADLPDRLATGLLALDRDLRLVWMNDAAGDLLEVGVRGLRGQPLADLLEASDLLDQARHRLRDGESRVIWRDLRLFSLRGRERKIDMTMQALPGERWLLEVHRLSQLPEPSTPWSATLRGVAHEVKNPLAGLRGAAQLLHKRSTDARTRELADMMIREADRLHDLTARLLEPEAVSRPGRINPHRLLERLCPLLRAEAPGLAIVEDYDPSLPGVQGDADRLHQLLLNVARNALQAGAGSICLRTRVAHRVSLGSGVIRAAVRIEVIDDGPGVPPGLRDSLFLPMVSGHAGGTGLGLALSREIARGHGGDLQHARTAEGTVFTLYLPLNPPDAQSVPEDKTQ